MGRREIFGHDMFLRGRSLSAIMGVLLWRMSGISRSFICTWGWQKWSGSNATRWRRFFLITKNWLLFPWRFKFYSKAFLASMAFLQTFFGSILCIYYDSSRDFYFFFLLFPLKFDNFLRVDFLLGFFLILICVSDEVWGVRCEVRRKRDGWMNKANLT